MICGRLLEMSKIKANVQTETVRNKNKIERDGEKLHHSLKMKPLLIIFE